MPEEAVKLPIPARVRKQLVFKFAEDFARALQFNVGDPLEPLVARLGGSISYEVAAEFAGGSPEAIKVTSPNKFTIFLPLNTSPERDRFTISHELGHLFLHYPLVQRTHGAHTTMVATRWVDEGNEDAKRAEWEANWFAAAFLMPAVAFRSSWAQAEGSAAAVGQHFVVTEMAAQVRAKVLGLPAL